MLVSESSCAGNGDSDLSLRFIGDRAHGNANSGSESCSSSGRLILALLRVLDKCVATTAASAAIPSTMPQEGGISESISCATGMKLTDSLVEPVNGNERRPKEGWSRCHTLNLSSTSMRPAS